jgi:hypothetical protein
MLTKKRSGLKPTTMNDLLFVRFNQDWCRRVIHITQFLNTVDERNLNSMGGHRWAWVAADGYGLGMGTNSKENVGLCSCVKWP